jgi:hypothetical protein
MDGIQGNLSPSMSLTPALCLCGQSFAERSGAMQCVRCNTKMLRSHHEETECIADGFFLTQVYVNECPFCSVMVKVVMPVLPGEEKTGMRSA